MVVLSHWIVIGASSSCTDNSESRRVTNNDSFAACDSANNSASAVDVVTVFCLLAFQAIVPPNSLMRNPWELFRSRVLSANDESLATSNPGSPPYCKAY